MKRCSICFGWLASVGLALAPTLAEAGTSARVDHFKGTVTVNKKEIKKNDVIPAGSTVVTGEGAVVILKQDGGNVTLKLDQLSELKVGGEPEIKKGGVFAKINSYNKKKPFRLRTRSASMGVRGTQFFAAFGRETKGETDFWMCVNEGEVKLTSLATKKSVDVKAGQGVLMPQGKKLTPPKPFAWTKKLNWTMDPSKGDVENKASLDSAYRDLLDQDYD